MSQANIHLPKDHDQAGKATGASSVVLVCEHASYHIPAVFDGLGLSQADRKSHAAWDPGALAVAQHMAHHLNAGLVAARVSRLVYDCNRPPSSADAMPARSEVIDVPGNRNLSPSSRQARIDAYCHPFRDAVRRAIQRVSDPIIVTVHSFTPVYYGKPRVVEIGILHDSDTRLADAMLNIAPAHTACKVERNQPYGPEDGVTHTLKEHAISAGYLNVMLEIRNDLISTARQQKAVAAMLSKWLVEAVSQMPVPGDLRCRA
ncbi:N-formylglutamate amidohydrolase [Rhodophyticola sp. CCM32]|uniref:N-formylglutamate amidohydrolase n=1 Tax=Rhodophyticola sp. CCM32 TaxID=2916397 RepID=UPI00107F5AF1|nr:N-formylglutamate amidohydrolase [Rhodophyticola sp. CCM32]QBY00788.1 N-formylglutamate amidohydrolase [Rhodophyticola sp. CCM32]